MNITETLAPLELTEEQTATITEWVSQRESTLAQEQSAAVTSATIAERAMQSAIQNQAQAEWDARLAVISGLPVPSSLLDQLNAAFKAALTPDAQAAFASPYAIVRVLVQAGEIELARSVIAGIEVPPELAEAKQGLIAILA